MWMCPKLKPFSLKFIMLLNFCFEGKRKLSDSIFVHKTFFFDYLDFPLGLKVKFMGYQVEALLTA